MEVITLSALDLSLAACLVIVLALLSRRMSLGLEKQLIVAAVRTTVQLLLIGQVLRLLFDHVNLLFVTLVALVMLCISGREVVARQHRPMRGVQAWLTGTGSMFVSSFSLTVFALVVLIGNDPWYTPQYAIPLLGMLLGNTMTGVALSMDRLTDTIWQQRQVIEQRLLLGEPATLATREIRQQAIRSGMMPIINSMAAAGLVSLPGMMTGQILGGSRPVDAVAYQILIMFLICGGTGFGVLATIWLVNRRLFDTRHRLRLEILAEKEAHK